MRSRETATSVKQIFSPFDSYHPALHIVVSIIIIMKFEREISMKVGFFQDIFMQTDKHEKLSFYNAVIISKKAKMS